VEIWPGRPYPLGATWDGFGVNFTLVSENATAVELCLFDADTNAETARIRLPEQTDYVWNGYMLFRLPSQLTGYGVAYAVLRGRRS
jgi:isoamylase